MVEGSPAPGRSVRPVSPIQPSPLRRWRMLGLAAVLFITGALYARALGFGFVYDDTNLILNNDQIHSWDGVQHAFSGSMWAFDEWTAQSGFYRPVTAVVQTVQWMSFGPEPAGYHAVSILLHLGVVAAVYWLCYALGWSLLGSVLAALVIGVHPLAIQPVTWISAVSDPLSLLLAVLALAMFVHADRGDRGPATMATAWGLMWLACLTLERAWLLAPVFGLYALLTPRPTRSAANRWVDATRRGGVFLLAIVAALALRWTVLDAGPGGPPVDVAAVLWSLPATALHHVLHLVYPFELSIAYDDALVTTPSVVDTALPVLVLLALVAVGVWLTRRYGRPGSGAFGIAAMVLLFAAAAGGGFTPGDVVQDRYAYSALALFAVWLGGLMPERLPTVGPGQLTFAGLTVWCVVLIALHVANLGVWESNRTLYERAVAMAPDKPRYLLNLSNTLKREGQPDTDCALLIRADAAAEAGAPGSDLVKLAFSLGNCHRDAKRYEPAAQAYDRAFAASQQTFAPAWENKVLAWLDAGDPNRAFRAARELTNVLPDHARGWHLAGVAAANQTNWAAAEFAFSRALQLAPSDRASQQMLGRVRAMMKTPTP